MHTTNETAKFVATRFVREDKAGIEAIAAGIVWGLHNPNELQQVLEGKSPAAWKALRTEIADKASEARARHWSTDVRKCATLVLTATPDLSADKLPAAMSEAVSYMVERLADFGSNANALRKAYAASVAPAAAPVAEPSEEQEPAPGEGAAPVDNRGAVEQVADLLKDMLDHGMTGNAKQGDIAQIVQFCVAAASEATLADIARMVNEAINERMDMQDAA